MLLQRIDHVGYAVRDLDDAVAHHQRLFGAAVAHRQTLEHDGVHEAMLAVGDSFIQLLAPARENSPVARFLERRGPGLHHVGYGVGSVAGALEDLGEIGVRLVDDHPRSAGRGRTVAFLHPSAVGGVLVELVEDPARGGIERSTGGVPGF